MSDKKPYRVVWAQYNHNEYKDALCCGLFRDAYATRDEARLAAFETVRADAQDEIDAYSPGDVPDEYARRTAGEIARTWIWRDTPWSLCEEHNDIESVYNIVMEEGC